jgi:hypothetical protein
MSLSPEMGDTAQNEAVAFLTCLDPTAKQFTFQTFDDTKKTKQAYIMHGGIADQQPRLGKFNARQHGVYVTVQETDFKGRSNENIRRIRAFFVEYDRKDGATDISHIAVMERLKFTIEPTMVVESSPGKYHFYWCLSEPLVADAAGVALFRGVMLHLIETYHSDPQCKDPARVLRVPGFMHNKGAPQPVKLIKADAATRYSIEQIRAAFPPVHIEERPKKAPSKPASNQTEVDEEIPQTWVEEAVKRKIRELRNANEGKRNGTLNDVAFYFGKLCETFDLDEDDIKDQLAEVAEEIGLETGEIRPTIESGFTGGAKHPMDLATAWLDWNPVTKGPAAMSVFNVGMLLDYLDIDVRYNEFTHRVEIEGLDGFTELNDQAQLRIWDKAHKAGLKVSEGFLHSALSAIAGYSSYHPVRDYFDSLRGSWDGVPRLDTWLSDYCGVADSAYVQCVGAKMMIATVRRIRKPGVKFDQMAVLEGIQGTGKSSLLRALAIKDEWFTDDMALTLGSKETIEQSEGKMIVEVPELQKMKHAELERVKAMLSRQTDRARQAYGRRACDAPRQRRG